MIGVELFVGHAGQMLDWGPGLCGQEVVEGQLRGSNNAEAFGKVKIVYTDSSSIITLKKKKCGSNSKRGQTGRNGGIEMVMSTCHTILRCF